MPKKTAAATTPQRRMSDEHNAALAEGREQVRVVRRYLEALGSHRPKRGRKRTPESIAKRPAAVDEQLGTADAQTASPRAGAPGPRSRTHWDQSDGADLDELETALVAVAAAYDERKGLSYELGARSEWNPAS